MSTKIASGRRDPGQTAATRSTLAKLYRETLSQSPSPGQSVRDMVEQITDCLLASGRVGDAERIYTRFAAAVDSRTTRQEATYDAAIRYQSALEDRYSDSEPFAVVRVVPVDSYGVPVFGSPCPRHNRIAGGPRLRPTHASEVVGPTARQLAARESFALRAKASKVRKATPAELSAVAALAQ